MTKRSGSNTRRRAISRPVRLTAEEDQEIRKRAAECGKTVSGFLRAAALGKKVNSLTDDRVLKEVMRLGALQKKLFIDGKRVGDREYAEVVAYARGAGITNGFIQEGGTAEESFIPVWDGEGVVR